jgi:hypothetical protein
MEIWHPCHVKIAALEEKVVLRVWRVVVSAMVVCDEDGRLFFRLLALNLIVLIDSSLFNKESVSWHRPLELFSLNIIIVHHPRERCRRCVLRCIIIKRQCVPYYITSLEESKFEDDGKATRQSQIQGIDKSTIQGMHLY